MGISWKLLLPVHYSIKGKRKLWQEKEYIIIAGGESLWRKFAHLKIQEKYP